MVMGTYCIFFPQLSADHSTAAVTNKIAYVNLCSLNTVLVISTSLGLNLIALRAPSKLAHILKQTSKKFANNCGLSYRFYLINWNWVHSCGAIEVPTLLTYIFNLPGRCLH